MKRILFNILIDIILVSGSFLFFAWIKPSTKAIILPHYCEPFLYFLLVWLAISLLIGKYNLEKVRSSKDVLVPVLICNFTILSVFAIFVYAFQYFSFSRLIVLGTIFSATFLEIGFGLTYYAFKIAVRISEVHDVSLNGDVVIPAPGTDYKIKIDEKHLKVDSKLDDRAYQNIKHLIIKESGDHVFNFINSSIDLRNPRNLVISTVTRFNILKQPDDYYHNVINLKRINDMRRINKFFESVNNILPLGGIFIDRAETYMLRKARILNKYPSGINYIYYFFDWVWKRAFPKLPITKKIYFFISRGRSRVISKAETFGRLYSCGFEITYEKLIGNYLYFCARKVGKPVYDYTPTYGPLIRLKRYGKDGKLINVYKFRTMHAYSEYLQEYIFDKYNLQDGGKFHNDFRVNTIGKFMRKVWLDELPMLLNILKGEMKIVGVRPLSKQYYELYSEELRQKRIRYKPGLIPPYYADMPKTLDEIMASEMKYLKAYEKHPFFTDVRYFFIAMYNIVFRKARSK